MGIKHLWTVLTPFCERKPLNELQGKNVAIDLSCWVCEAQNVTENIQPKMYLRNLYFRTCYLLLMEVNPIFVLEGKPPELKFATMAARNVIQFKGTKPKGGVSKVNKDRLQFNCVLRYCEEMLKYMGLACIKGKGEAEATCAYLNEDGLVDGCISQDSDCFAYGAQVVYRNFSISQQGAYSGVGGAVDVYNIKKAIDNVNFGRNKVIAMAVLCGSDYCDGVYGIGKEAVLKLFDVVPEKDILDRLRSWKTSTNLYDEFYEQINNKNLCTSCGHLGKLYMHNKTGCKDCKTIKGCDFSKFKDKRLEIKNEVSMRSKALVDPNFPNEDLINEFLVRKDNVLELDLQWRQPDLINFIKFTVKHLQWEHMYAFEKFLPIFTRWQLTYFEMVTDKQKGLLYPDHIKKIRKVKGILSYEILWVDQGNFYKDILPFNHLQQAEKEKLWSTIEPQILVNKAYPTLVQSFEQSKIKPKKASKRRNPKKTVDDVEQMLANTSISEPKPKKYNRKPKAQIKYKTIDSYFKKAILNNIENNINVGHSTSDDENDSELSVIVDEIVKHNPLTCIQKELNKLGYYANEAADEVDLNRSSFFITETVDDDLFENSMKAADTSEDEDADDKSFTDDYVPLLTRLQTKSKPI